MSGLTRTGDRLFERPFDSGGAYVLNFSDRTVQEFLLDSAAIEICGEKRECESGLGDALDRGLPRK